MLIVLCAHFFRLASAVCPKIKGVCVNFCVPIDLILPPYRIIGQIYILRQILTINFSQENMRYLT
jgi:hypothetical protein